jgi:hypothetical protein
LLGVHSVLKYVAEQKSQTAIVEVPARYDRPRPEDVLIGLRQSVSIPGIVNLCKPAFSSMSRL